MKQAHTFCSYCGSKHTQNTWPRTCTACKQTIWNNPLPVVVALIPVGTGVLLVRRGITPGKGKLAFPGGYMEVGETWQEATAREVLEETGLVFEPDEFLLPEVASSSNRETLLVFSRATRKFGEGATAIENFKPNNEVTELVVARTSIPLAFPLHTEKLADYFGR